LFGVFLGYRQLRPEEMEVPDAPPDWKKLWHLTKLLT
jgi:hypothetical protein